MTNTNQTTDLFYTSTTDGFDFAADSDTLTIAAGVFVGSQQGDGVDSTHSGNVLTNNGNILGGKYAGVYFTGNNGTIVNNAGHNVIGRIAGIDVEGNVESVTNHGTVMSLSSVGVRLGANHVTLINDGDVYGRAYGVAVSSSDGGTIHNTRAGLIRSDEYDGIVVETAAGKTTSITNDPQATIRGADHSISSFFAGAISLNNLGTLIGDIGLDAPNENDVIHNSGAIHGAVFLGSGNDLFDGTGGTSGNLYGGAGNDTITPGIGHAEMFGGTGADTFKFVTAKGLPKGTDRDVIQDFNAGEGDRIDLSAIHLKHHAHLKFMGSEHFHDHAGEVRLAHGVLSADLDGDGKTDLQVALTGVTSLTPGIDLILHA